MPKLDLNVRPQPHVAARGTNEDKKVGTKRLDPVDVRPHNRFDSRFDGTRASSSTAGFSRLSGHRGTEESASGFALMERLSKMSSKAKRGLVAAAIGFTLLLPPGVGQMMHPGMPSAASPIAMQMQQKSALPGADAIKHNVDVARSRVPGGAGADRADAVRNVIHVFQDAQGKTAKAHALDGKAHQTLDQLKQTVGLDARMGYAVDWYWFGVPASNAAYHAGATDTKTLDGFVGAMDQATQLAHAGAREEVSKLLAAENPAYASLHTHYEQETARLQTGKQLLAVADGAISALNRASNAITMRNVTPRTVSVDDYETRTVGTGKDAHSERVKVGSHEELNPTWAMWNTMAIAAKADAESGIHQLNQDVKSAAAELGLAQQGDINADLIGALDFFGQPSFLIWSFDSSDVSQAHDKAVELRGALDQRVSEIQQVHDNLQTQVNHQIDLRWDALMAPVGQS